MKFLTELFSNSKKLIHLDNLQSQFCFHHILFIANWPYTLSCNKHRSRICLPGKSDKLNMCSSKLDTRSLVVKKACNLSTKAIFACCVFAVRTLRTCSQFHMLS